MKSTFLCTETNMIFPITSLGECAALMVSEALTMEDALRMIALRAKLMVENCAQNASGMIACKISPSQADALIQSERKVGDLEVACRNSDEDSVVAGPLEQIGILEEICSERKIQKKKLDVPFGYHSSSIQPIAEPLKKLGASICWSKPKIPVVSNLYGRLFEDGELGSDYFAMHARMPVKFDESISNMRSHGIFEDAICLEVGPHPITLPMLRTGLKSTECALLSTLQKDKAAWVTLGTMLSQLFLLSDSTNWRETFAGSSAKMIDLPSYPLMGSTFAKPYQESVDNEMGTDIAKSTKPYKSTGFNLLPMQNTSQNSDSHYSFETSMAILGPMIAGHNVGGTAICPASVFHELALEAVRTVLDLEDTQVLLVQNLAFASPLIHDPDAESRTVHVRLQRSATKAEFEFGVAVENSSSKETVCCSGTVCVQSTEDLHVNRLKAGAIVKRQGSHLLASKGANLSVFQTRILYDSVFTRVVRYSREYQSIRNFSVSESSLEAIGTFRLPDPSKVSSFVAPPVFTDTLLHAAGFVANLIVNSEEICICAHVGSIEVPHQGMNYAAPFTVYCSLVDMSSESYLADAFAVDESGQVVAIILSMEFKKLSLANFQKYLQHSSPQARREPAKAKPTATIASQEPLSETTSNAPAQREQAKTTNKINEIRPALTRLIADVSGFSGDELDFSASLDALGLDSMIQIELAGRLKEEYADQGFDPDSLAACETVLDIERILMSVLEVTPETGQSNDDTASTPESTVSGSDTECNLSRNTTPDVEEKNPIALHVSTKDSTPLCLIHDGSGLVRMYSKLQDLDRNMYAFFDPHFSETKSPFSKLAQMAAQYALNLSRTNMPSVILGGTYKAVTPFYAFSVVTYNRTGWSFGGIVAYEACQQLANLGVEVKGLVLIDSPYPVDHEPLPAPVISHVTKSGPTTIASGGVLANEFERNASLLGAYQASPLSEKLGIKTVMLRSEDTLDTEALCGVKYDWLSSQQARDEAIAQWEGLLGQDVQVLPIPGNHFEAFAPKNVSWA